MLLAWVKKVHMYAGLFTFTALFIYGLSGIVDSLLPAWSERQSPPTTEEYAAFQAPNDLSDKALADLVYEELNMPLTGPPADYSLRRDEAQNLVVSFYTPNGVRTVTVLENEGRLRVVRAAGGMASFITGMHGATLQYAAPRFLTQAWAYYNEAGLWALGLMSISGVILWLGTRPRLIWAQAAFAAGSGSFVLLYWLIR